MSLHYKTILSLQARHGYYTLNEVLCPDLSFVPSATTQQWLNRYRCLWRNHEAGFSLLQQHRVLNPERAQGEVMETQALVSWDEPQELTIYVSVDQERFHHVTDLEPRDLRSQLMYYSNEDSGSDGEGTFLNATTLRASSNPFSASFIHRTAQKKEQVTAFVRLLDPRNNDTVLWKERWVSSGWVEADDNGDTVYDFSFSGTVGPVDIAPGKYTLEWEVAGTTSSQSYFLDTQLPTPLPLAVIQIFHDINGQTLDLENGTALQIRFTPPEFVWTYKVQLPADWPSQKQLDIIDKKVENPNPSSPYPTAYFATTPDNPQWKAGETIAFTSVDASKQNDQVLPMLDTPNADLVLWQIKPGPGNSPDTPEAELMQAPNPSISKAERTMYLTLK